METPGPSAFSPPVAPPAARGRRFAHESPPEFSLVDDLIFHDVAAALALPCALPDGDSSSNSNSDSDNRDAKADDAFVDSLLRLEEDAPGSAEDLEVALLAGEMMLSASQADDPDHANIMALYDFRRDLGAMDDDAATDVASESSSPPPASPFPASPSPPSLAQAPSLCQPYSPPRLLPAQPVAKRLAPARAPPSAASPVHKTEPQAPPPLAAMPSTLPYALPVAYFAPGALNANQKRPLADVLPSGPGYAQAGGRAAAGAAGPADSGDDHSAKKSKREIRQMKNRESANKSRLRRKAQLGELTSEVAELKKKEQELQMVIAGLRAENKALQSQNSFLQSLVTSAKRPQDAPASSSSPHKRVAVYDHHPSAPAHANFIALPVLDAQDHACLLGKDDELEVLDTRAAKRKRSLASVTTASAATLTMCASVFGITLLADLDGDYATTGSIRQSGRVLHEVSPAVGADGCSPDHGPFSVAVLGAKLLAAWDCVTTSELAYGVLLNVLSFVVIMAVYRWWQQSPSTENLGKSCRGARYGGCAHLRHHACGRGAPVDGTKQRSASWHMPSVHVDDDASDEECPGALR